jgi:hypothetical protein
MYFVLHTIWSLVYNLAGFIWVLSSWTVPCFRGYRGMHTIFVAGGKGDARRTGQNQKNRLPDRFKIGNLKLKIFCQLPWFLQPPVKSDPAGVWTMADEQNRQNLTPGQDRT